MRMTPNYLYSNNTSIIKISFQSHLMRHDSASSMVSVALDVIKNISILPGIRHVTVSNLT